MFHSIHLADAVHFEHSIKALFLLFLLQSALLLNFSSCTCFVMFCSKKCRFQKAKPRTLKIHWIELCAEVMYESGSSGLHIYIYGITYSIDRNCFMDDITSFWIFKMEIKFSTDCKHGHTHQRLKNGLMNTLDINCCR